MKKFPGFLEHFRHVNAGFPVDKAIVVRDADHKNSEALISQMESKISGRTYPFGRNLLVAVEKMEAWLLADDQALSSVTNNPRSARRRAPRRCRGRHRAGSEGADAGWGGNEKGSCGVSRYFTSECEN